MTISKDTIVAVIGLGYVGLPLAVEFGQKYKTIGFDLSETKIASYQKHCDPTGEVGTADLRAAMRPDGLEVTTDPSRLVCADFLIVAVPTPVDDTHIPDFSPLVSSSTTVGRRMKRGATVIYESTVYPGATEEICIPNWRPVYPNGSDAGAFCCGCDQVAAINESGIGGSAWHPICFTRPQYNQR